MGCLLFLSGIQAFSDGLDYGKKKINPDAFLYSFNCANECALNGNAYQAIKYYEESLEHNPKCPEVHFNLGIQYLTQNNIDKAKCCFEKAIEFRDNYAKAHLFLGRMFREKKEYTQAIQQFNYAYKLEPQMLEAQIACARTYIEMNNFEMASDLLNEVHKKKPTDRGVMFELANALNMIYHHKKALALYQDLEKESPNYDVYRQNIAYTLKRLGRYSESIWYYQQVLQNNPDNASAHMHLSFLYLLIGDFKNGWEHYEWRWKTLTDDPVNRDLGKPIWNGENINGRTILIHAEQGLGDSFQFIRYAKKLKQMGARVIFAVQKPLVQLLQNCDYLDHVCSLYDKVPVFDTHIALMSLPKVFRTNFNSIPHEVPYLFAAQNLINHWKKKLAHYTTYNIGICWNGSTHHRSPFLQATVAEKSIGINLFALLSEVKNVQLFSLQKQTGMHQLENLQFNLITFDDDFDTANGRFMDTAAVMKNLDLVITIDTSIAHLAGGLGVSTWILLPHTADFRWLIDRPDSPWYPTMRLFRQKKPGEWKDVMQEVKKELESLVLKKNKSIYKKVDDISSLLIEHAQTFACIKELRTRIKNIILQDDAA